MYKTLTSVIASSTVADLQPLMLVVLKQWKIHHECWLFEWIDKKNSFYIFSKVSVWILRCIQADPFPLHYFLMEYLLLYPVIDRPKGPEVLAKIENNILPSLDTEKGREGVTIYQE